MKKIIYVLTTVALTFLLCACSTNQPPVIDAEQNSENSPDWAGVYAGVIPAASGPGINVTITLRNDLTYEAHYHYIDRPDGDTANTGTFKWNEDRSVITLDAAGIPPYYQVAEDGLIQLDMEGSLITGMLADDYVLKKQP